MTNEQIKQEFRQKRKQKESLSINPDLTIESGVSVMVRYFLEVLNDISLPFTYRKSFLIKYKYNETYRNLFQSKHHLSEEEENQYHQDALKYITDIRLDIRKRLKTLSIQDRALLISDDKKTKDFLSKYIPTEEDLQQDKFL